MLDDTTIFVRCQLMPSRLFNSFRNNFFPNLSCFVLFFVFVLVRRLSGLSTSLREAVPRSFGIWFSTWFCFWVFLGRGFSAF